jgi:ATP-dependent DNA helicase RecQ
MVSPTEEYDAALFERLRSQRMDLAREQALPPYCIFNDRTLRAMAAMAPTTHADLLQIHGVGTTKAHKYGDIFLAIIRAYQTG